MKGERGAEQDGVKKGDEMHNERCREVKEAQEKLKKKGNGSAGMLRAKNNRPGHQTGAVGQKQTSMYYKITLLRCRGCLHGGGGHGGGLRVRGGRHGAHLSLR